ncbi:MAG TPA: dienelactone hydrolase family protein [Candidatus Manganitrophaceae bacterium]|nr:dienelactone hydrolase family protein [Candidatus Manganitrophaceae bacterium]
MDKNRNNLKKKAETARGEAERLIHIPAEGAVLEGVLAVPGGAEGVVLFSHGSGSSRHSPRNNYVARVLREAGLGTLLFDLLTEREDANYEARFDIDLLTRRLIAATRWFIEQDESRGAAVGYFGSSTGAASALQAAAALGPAVGAVVSRGGRPDLAERALPLVQAPTLLIVGGYDLPVILLNRQAYDQMTVERELKVIPGASHLFEEPGTLEEAARLATEWFKRHLHAKRG